MAGVALVLLGEDRDLAFASYAADSVFMILGSLIIAQGITKSGAQRLKMNKNMLFLVALEHLLKKS